MGVIAEKSIGKGEAIRFPCPDSSFKLESRFYDISGVECLITVTSRFLEAATFCNHTPSGNYD